MNENINFLSREIIGCAIRIHKALGPGLLESVYETCLEYELQKAGYSVERQKAVPIVYNEVKLDYGYRIDILVDKAVLVEIKSTEGFTDVHEAQILTYLKLSGLRLGLLINFNVKLLKDGLRRYIF
jgi:GxxExxY protein